MSLTLPRWSKLLLILLTLLGFWWTLHIQLTVPAPYALGQGQQVLEYRRVLAVVAHPDDLEWYIGGTLHLLAEQGADVEVVVASDGERGPNRIQSSDLRATRRAEQERAGAINGYTHIHFLGLPDRRVSNGPALMQQVSALYRQLKPEAVFIFDPDYPAYPYLHADHQGSARAVLRYWQGLAGPKPPLYLFQTRRPNVAVDITSAIQTKAQAMEAHVSQGGGSAMLKTMFGAEGRRVGVGYAELFRKVEK